MENDLNKQLDFIINTVPKVFMNTNLKLAISEIKKLKVETHSCMPIADVSNAVCGVCKKNPPSMNYTIDSKYTCSDCYFDLLGDIVESHPVGRP